MPEQPECPTCGTRLSLRQEEIKSDTKCPECGQLLQKKSAAPQAAEGILEVLPATSPAVPELTQRCPRCHKRVPLSAEQCPHCKAWLDEPVEDEDYPSATRWKPCPRCGARGAERVTWTFWGSFYGPALFKHVRCPECRYGYNGSTGRSNIIPAIIMVVVPLIGIVAILGGLAYLIISTMPQR